MGLFFVYFEYFEYLPYGESWQKQKNTKVGTEDHNPKFNSQELDTETNFYYYNARHYDPEIGRFVTADPVVDGVYSLQGWNGYLYVQDNPIQYSDPTGNESKYSQISSQGYSEYLGSPKTERQKRYENYQNDQLKKKVQAWAKKEALRKENALKKARRSKPPVSPTSARGSEVVLVTQAGPYYNDGSWHYGGGIDIACSGKHKVFFVASGKISDIHKGTVGKSPAGSIEYEDKEGYKVRYKHITNTQKYSKGKKIKSGMKVGKPDLTGKTSGYHLHFEVKKNGKIVDPIWYLRRVQPNLRIELTPAARKAYKLYNKKAYKMILQSQKENPKVEKP